MNDEKLLSEFYQYLWLNERLSIHTIKNYLSDIKRFLLWRLISTDDLFTSKIRNSTQSIDLLNTYLKNTYLLMNVDQSLLDNYFTHDTRIITLKNTHYTELFKRKIPSKILKLKISLRSRIRFLASIKRFFQFMIDEEYRLDDPTLKIKIPHFKSPLPVVLGETGIVSLMNAPDVDTPIGLRDRAMLELLYAGGFRAAELVSLTLTNVNLERGSARFIGKGDKERIVCIGEEAIYWVLKYLELVRGDLIQDHRRPSEHIFINKKGQKMSAHGLWCIVKRYAKMIKKPKVSPHTIRHSFATHLINHGADIRVVQLLLGHSFLSSTQIYIHVSIARLKKIHAKYHPRG